MVDVKRKQAEVRGHRSETLAAWALRLKGWRICERRYKTRAGEVDIIARKRNLVIMVEVKARPTLTEAMDAVTHTALRRIEAAGDMWLARQPDFAQLSVRYDIVAIVPRKWPIHIENVFAGGQ